MTDDLELRSYIRNIPDYPKPGIVFRDITPLLLDAGALDAATGAIVEWARPREVDLVVSAEYILEYGVDALEMHADALAHGARVLVHDDLLATGGTARALCNLVEGR